MGSACAVQVHPENTNSPTVAAHGDVHSATVLLAKSKTVTERRKKELRESLLHDAQSALTALLQRRCLGYAPMLPEVDDDIYESVEKFHHSSIGLVCDLQVRFSSLDADSYIIVGPAHRFGLNDGAIFVGHCMDFGHGHGRIKIASPPRMVWLEDHVHRPARRPAFEDGAHDTSPPASQHSAAARQQMLGEAAGLNSASGHPMNNLSINSFSDDTGVAGDDELKSDGSPEAAFLCNGGLLVLNVNGDITKVSPFAFGVVKFPALPLSEVAISRSPKVTSQIMSSCIIRELEHPTARGNISAKKAAAEAVLLNVVHEDRPDGLEVFSVICVGYPEEQSSVALSAESAALAPESPATGTPQIEQASRDTTDIEPLKQQRPADSFADFGSFLVGIGKFGSSVSMFGCFSFSRELSSILAANHRIHHSLSDDLHHPKRWIMFLHHASGLPKDAAEVMVEVRAISEEEHSQALAVHTSGVDLGSGLMSSNFGTLVAEWPHARISASCRAVWQSGRVLSFPQSRPSSSDHKYLCIRVPSVGAVLINNPKPYVRTAAAPTAIPSTANSVAGNPKSSAMGTPGPSFAAGISSVSSSFGNGSTFRRTPDEVKALELRIVQARYHNKNGRKAKGRNNGNAPCDVPGLLPGTTEHNNNNNNKRHSIVVPDVQIAHLPNQLGRGESRSPSDSSSSSSSSTSSESEEEGDEEEGDEVELNEEREKMNEAETSLHLSPGGDASKSRRPSSSTSSARKINNEEALKLQISSVMLSLGQADGTVAPIATATTATVIDDGKLSNNESPKIPPTSSSAPSKEAEKTFGGITMSESIDMPNGGGLDSTVSRKHLPVSSPSEPTTSAASLTVNQSRKSLQVISSSSTKRFDNDQTGAVDYVSMIPGRHVTLTLQGGKKTGSKRTIADDVRPSVVMQFVPYCPSSRVSKRIFFVRHGESTWNHLQKRKEYSKLATSGIDHPLSAKGVAQAQALASFISQCKMNAGSTKSTLTSAQKDVAHIGMVVSSPLCRAVQTALVALQPVLKVNPYMILCPNAREKRNFGGKDTSSSSVGEQVMNKAKEELAEHLGVEEATQLCRLSVSLEEVEDEWWCESRESVSELKKRIVEFFYQLQLLPFRYIAVVGHSHYFRLMLRMFMTPQCKKITPELCAVLEEEILPNCGVLAADLTRLDITEVSLVYGSLNKLQSTASS